MGKNRVQFQKGLSEIEFRRLYGSEEKCRRALFEWRWPEGFICPSCGNKTYCEIKGRGVFQCNRCRRQTSLTAGTIFHKTHLPLTTWFLAIYLLTQGKHGISSIELGRRLGVTQWTAWKLQHKLMQVMLEWEGKKQLNGRIELDDSYIGGQKRGKKRGRGAPGKTPFVAAVQTIDDGKPDKIKLSRVAGFRLSEIEACSKKHLEPGSRVTVMGFTVLRRSVLPVFSIKPS